MRQFETFELEFQGTAPQGSQSIIDLKTTFTMDGAEKEIKGFYAGNNIYKVRYYPQKSGKCTWRTSSGISLTGPLEGEEECLPALDGMHGMVQADGIHFRHEDGTRYLSVGTTVYALIHQEKELIEETMESLKKAPFNKVRLCVFPKDYDFNHNDPECYAFEKTNGTWDVDRPCFLFWDRLEQRILELQEMGIQVDLILFHPYDKWGFSRFSKEECLVYLGYVVRRLSAFPNIWWSMANEYDLMEYFEKEWWYEFSDFLHTEDLYGHLLSNHNCLKYWDFSEPNTTHCSIQYAGMIQTPDLQKEYGKPVIFDECGYEGNLPNAWGNLTAFDLLDHFWTAFAFGGYCTHGETIWNKDEVLWWSKGGVLSGKCPERIGFLRSVLEELPGDLDPFESQFDRERLLKAMKDPEQAKRIPYVIRSIARMDDEPFQCFMNGNREIFSHCGDKVYLRYWGRHCPLWSDMILPEEHSYSVEVIDIWEMTRETVLTGVSGAVRVPMPGKEGIVVLAKVLESWCGDYRK